MNAAERRLREWLSSEIPHVAESKRQAMLTVLAELDAAREIAKELASASSDLLSLVDDSTQWLHDSTQWREDEELGPRWHEAEQRVLKSIAALAAFDARKTGGG